MVADSENNTTAVIWTIKDGKAYQIWLTTKTDNFSNYLPIFEKMMDSFEIIDGDLQ